MMNSIYSLTNRHPVWQSPCVPDKEGNGFCSLNYKKAHKRRNAVFLRAYVVVCLLWVAVAGAFGLLVFFFVPVCKPAICRPPCFAAGSGLTVQRGANP
jgi:hypothetical protein